MENIKEQLDACLLLTKKQAENDKADRTYYEMLQDFIMQLKALVSKSEPYFDTQIKTKSYKQSLQICLMDLIEDLQVLLEMDLAAAKKTKTYELLDSDVAELEDWIEDMNEAAETIQLAYLSSWDIGYFFE